MGSEPMVATDPTDVSALFIQSMHAEQSLASVNSTRGVSNLVYLGSGIVTCPDALIKHVRGAEAQLNSEKSPTCIAAGETIEIVSGPFQGLVSRVVEATEDHAFILLEVLGNLQTLGFSVALCRKLQE